MKNIILFKIKNSSLFKPLQIALMAFFLISNYHEADSQSDNELRTVFQDAEYALMSENYEQALEKYIKIYKSNPENANINFRIGFCYLNIPGKKINSIPYLEFASEHITDKYKEGKFKETMSPPQTLFLLATTYQINEQFKRAKKYFYKYKNYVETDDIYEMDFVDNQIKACDIAEQKIDHPLHLVQEKIDWTGHQDSPNYNPIMTKTGDLLLYTTKEEFHITVWMMKKQNNQWLKPVNINAQLGSEGTCHPTSITKEGETLYLVCINNSRADILTSRFIDGKFTRMEKLGKPINTKYAETHAAVSPDGNTLFFTSNRKNGYGGLDIYKSIRNNRGEFEDPVNLGPVINSRYNEETPFITDDGKTLFFASQGHSGMGGFDIYKSTLDDTDEWSVPVNLGYPVNNSDDNMFWFPLDNGDRALYAGITNENEPYSGIKQMRILKSESSSTEKIPQEPYLENKHSIRDNNISFTIVNSENKDTISKLIPHPDYYDLSESLPAGNYDLISCNSEYQEQVSSLHIVDNESYSGMNEDNKTQKNSSGKFFEKREQYASAFGIQLYALKKIPQKDILKNSGESISLWKGQDYLYRIISGQYTNKDEALEKLTEIKNKGYKDAFIVDLNQIAQSNQTLSGAKHSIYTENKKFTIQIKALHKPVEKDVFTNVKEIYVLKGTDGLYRYTTGEFQNKENALPILKEMKNIGYQDAFITQLTDN